jgi:hypothetical protein
MDCNVEDNFSKIGESYQGILEGKVRGNLSMIQNAETTAKHVYSLGKRSASSQIAFAQFTFPTSET